MMKLANICFLLFVFFFDNIATTWCQNPYHLMRMQLKTLASSNGILPSVEAEPLSGQMVNHFAAYLSIPDPEPVLYGAMTTIDVYESLNVNGDQIVTTGIWVGNYQPGHPGSANILQAGWIVYPSYYGDNKTHFYTLWTADGYNSTGCFDLECTGFVPVNDAPITPGDTLKGNGQISIKISKTIDDEDWWLKVAKDGHDFSRVGYWPQSLFNSLADHANHASWGGYTGSPPVTPSPPMGNGQWPGKHSATFQDVQFVNKSGVGYGVFPTPGIHPYTTHKKCYQVSEFSTAKFAYGGPGGC